MTVRLTKALREEIIEKIYKASDLPTRLEDLQAGAKKKAADTVRSTWPEGFAEAAKTLPREWFGSVTVVYISCSLQHEDTGEYFDLSSETIGSFYARDIQLDDPIPYPQSVQGVQGNYRYLIHEWLHDIYRPQYQAWAADRAKLYQSAHALLNSYRTVEALLKAAPEMKQFIPTASVSYSPPAIPVSNVISTFLERGIVFQTT